MHCRFTTRFVRCTRQLRCICVSLKIFENIEYIIIQNENIEYIIHT